MKEFLFTYCILNRTFFFILLEWLFEIYLFYMNFILFLENYNEFEIICIAVPKNIFIILRVYDFGFSNFWIFMALLNFNKFLNMYILLYKRNFEALFLNMVIVLRNLYKSIKYQYSFLSWNSSQSLVAVNILQFSLRFLCFRSTNFKSRYILRNF